MANTREKIEHRLHNMKTIYVKASALIDQLPPEVPVNVKTMLKNKIIGDANLRELMSSLDSHRPPKIFMIGRTGFGKSSIINALCEGYVAPVSDTISCTNGVYSYECRDGDRVLMEILDTRGIAESVEMIEGVAAEDMIIQQVKDFSPDVAILVLNCTHRDDVDSDVDFVKKVASEYRSCNGCELPVVVAINKCDEMAPAREKRADAYPESKIRKINEVVEYFKGIINSHDLHVEDIVAVSSLIDWQDKDGNEVDVDAIRHMTTAEIESLQIAFDGRYGIERLFDILESAIRDSEAKMGLRMAARLEVVIHRIAQKISNIFATISATVAATPIPVSDIFILIPLQALLVMLIAAISGRDIDFQSAKEFVFSLGGISGLGYGLRLLAQQASKFVNLVFPTAGSVVSGGIAFFGTKAIGTGATAYFIDGFSMNEAKKFFEEEAKKS